MGTTVLSVDYKVNMLQFSQSGMLNKYYQLLKLNKPTKKPAGILYLFNANNYV